MLLSPKINFRSFQSIMLTNLWLWILSVWSSSFNDFVLLMKDGFSEAAFFTRSGKRMPFFSFHYSLKVCCLKIIFFPAKPKKFEIVSTFQPLKKFCFTQMDLPSRNIRGILSNLIFLSRHCLIIIESVNYWKKKTCFLLYRFWCRNWSGQ